MPEQDQYPQFGELGRTGLRRFGGRIYEEWLPELQGRRGVRVYKEMRDNDPVIGAILFAIKMLMRRASWRVEAASGARKDQEAKDFLASCMDDMSQTWEDTITEVLSMIVFGWSYQEIVYKKRSGQTGEGQTDSKYKDGRIGWRKISNRGQETLLRWEFDDEDGGLRAMIQVPPPDYIERIIPIEKALLFRTQTNLGNPEGRSVLRNAYRPWYFKRRMEEIEGIGIERDLAGLPVITPPEGIDIWNENDTKAQLMREEAENVVQNLRRDEMEGVVKPFGWELELLSTGGRRQIDVSKVVDRYDARIAMTVLGDFILLGHQEVGSFALSSNKTALFSDALGAWLDMIESVFNRYAVPRLFALNPGLPQEELPQLVHGDVESPDIAELGAYIKEVSGVGALTPGPELERYLREAANLPQEDDSAP